MNGGYYPLTNWDEGILCNTPFHKRIPNIYKWRYFTSINGAYEWVTGVITSNQRKSMSLLITGLLGPSCELYTALNVEPKVIGLVQMMFLLEQLMFRFHLKFPGCSTNHV